MKKIIALALFALLSFQNIAFCEKIGHGDLAAPSEWAIEDIGYGESIGMLDDFKASWTSDITREEFCTLIFNMLDFGMKPYWNTINQFSDTENEKIAALYNFGIINGRGDGIFDPENTITREEAAVILNTVSLKTGMDPDSIISTLIAYADDEKISDWARNSVYNMRKIEVMTGTDAGFEPKSNITVEQAVATIVRLHKAAYSRERYEESFAGKLDAMMPDDENYVISPFSVKLALLLAANGADGETLEEIKETLGVSDLGEYNLKMKELLAAYSQMDTLRLEVSNSIWVNTDKTSQRFSDKFKGTVSEFYNATADTVTDDDAADKINGWVKEKTNGKIPKIVNEDKVDFWAMLVNAVYFKGRWVKEFSKEATAPGVFTDKNGKEHEIDFMKIYDFWTGYGKSNGVEIVELPYLNFERIFDETGEWVNSRRIENSNISMFLIMSDEEINPVVALGTMKMRTENILLSMPKFKVEYSQNLADTIKELGINKAFSKDAEFSQMFTKDSMWLTSILHKTYINVDEEGTEAAAATLTGMAGASLLPIPKKVSFNKPFHFVIRDNVNGEILFMGSYSYVKED